MNLLICKISVLIICISLGGCTKNLSGEEQRFIGTWKMEGMETTITFYSNGGISGFFGDEFEVKDGKFVILTRYAGTTKQELYNYTFSNNDTRLILININTKVVHTLIKQ